MAVNGLNQRELAKKIGVAPSTVSEWLHRHHEPRIGCFYKLAKAFDLTMDELFGTPIDTKRHLCNDCNQSFATCDAVVIAFGDGVGNDNVIECDGIKI
jgi:transcriptional regulator with XRE-family HTH domain